MKQFKSAVILCVVAVVMLFTSLLVYINFQAYKSRKSAEELLQDLRGMKVGETYTLGRSATRSYPQVFPWKGLSIPAK